jgi:hypothetical protein
MTEENLRIALRENVIGFQKSMGERAKSLLPEDLITFYVSRQSLTSQIPVQRFVACAVVMSKSYKLRR